MKHAYSGVRSAHQYARAILSGEIPACRWIRLACERHLKDLARSAKDASWPYRFDAEKAERVIKFLELMPHTKGEWARKRLKLVLSPWQRFFVAVAFGWVRKDNGLRRFRRVSLYVPRKNGKSLLVAGIGNYMLTADNEFGAEVYCGATTEKQAWEVFKPAKLMVDKLPSLARKYKLTAHARKIVSDLSGSLFEPVIGKPGDGSSPHCAINDEYHEQQTDDLVDTMLTGMGARDQPMMIDATTAGTDISGPCYAHQVELQKVLEGVVEADDLFGLIYTLDADDDWTSEEALIKANPNFGISVGSEFLNLRLAEARRNSRHQNRFKIKHLNIWVSARAAYFNMDHWHRQEDKTLKIEDFYGQSCWLALDLASKVDITAKGRLFKRDIDGVEHFYFVGPRFYLPETTAADPERQHYSSWVYDGHLFATDGDIIDFNAIREDVVEDSELFDVEELAYDAWGATQLAQELQDEYGMTVAEVPMNVKYLSEPMKWIEALLKAGRFHHDGNPVMTWMMSNVTAKEDRNENVFPCKEKSANKIDGALALIMALGRAMAQEEVDSKAVTQGFVEI